MAKPNYSFEKRQRELAKKKKQEEKRQRKAAEKPDKALWPWRRCAVRDGQRHSARGLTSRSDDDRGPWPPIVSSAQRCNPEFSR